MSKTQGLIIESDRKCENELISYPQRTYNVAIKKKNKLTLGYKIIMLTKFYVKWYPKFFKEKTIDNETSVFL